MTACCRSGFAPMSTSWLLAASFISLVYLSAAGGVHVAPPGFPRFSWDTLPVFWHAWGAEPFNKSTLEFINRFPIVTIEKGMNSAGAPAHKGAESKIVAAAKQVKEYNSTIKVLFYLNSLMDWSMYDLHQYCLEHKELMWLYDSRGEPVAIRNESLFNLASDTMHKVWLDVLRKANSSGWIDGAFVDRGGDPIQRWPAFKFVSQDVFDAYVEGHRRLMNEINETFGERFIAVSNAQDYPTVSGRMFERFLHEPASAYADLVTLRHEATYPHIVEVHGEPRSPTMFNATLAAYLAGAGEYAYYGCTDGFSLDSGWLHWFPEYSKPLGAPLSAAVTITNSSGFCSSPDAVHLHTVNDLWEDLLEHAEHVHYNPGHVKRWVRKYMSANPNAAQPILGRRFKSGTCVTVDFNRWPPASCISWADGTHTGSSVQCL